MFIHALVVSYPWLSYFGISQSWPLAHLFNSGPSSKIHPIFYLCSRFSLSCHSPPPPPPPSLNHLPSFTFLSPSPRKNPLTFSSSFSDITIFLEVNSPACLQASHSFYYNCLQEHIHSLFTPPQSFRPQSLSRGKVKSSINPKLSSQPQ